VIGISPGPRRVWISAPAHPRERALAGGRVPGAAGQLAAEIRGDWEDGGAVGPSPGGSPPVRGGPRAGHRCGVRALGLGTFGRGAREPGGYDLCKEYADR
jgi:hypothetical protein